MLLQSLADHFGGDSQAAESTRVLPLPGFANHERSVAFIVSARQVSDAIHTPRDFALSEGWQEASRPLLDRGDDADLVIKRLTDPATVGDTVEHERGDHGAHDVAAKTPASER